MSAQFLVVFQLTGFAFRRWFFPPISSSILLCCLFPSSALLLNLKKQTHQKQNGKYMAVSQNCVWNVLRRSGRTERRGFVTGLVPAIHKLYVYIYIYMYTVNMYIIYISRTCTLKLLTLAAARFHFSSARHLCCTPVQRRFALHG